VHFLVKYDPKQALFHIIDYNLMFSFSRVLFNPMFFNIMLGLTNSFYNTFSISQECKEITWKYI
jgi:hypothetical protein